MFVNIDGVNVHYKVSGEGKNVLLLHGWGQSIQAFEPVHQHLEKNFKVYTIDFPGFGQSDTPPHPWEMEDYTVLVEKLVNKLQIDNPILMGHSFGGRVSIIFASRNNVNKVILVDSAGVKPKRKLSYYIKVYTFKTAKYLLNLPGLRHKKEEHLQKLRAKFGSSDYKGVSGVMQQTMVKVVNEDLKHFMPQISASTLLVWGENDTATPVTDGKIMEKLIPDAGLVVLPNCGHFSYLERLPQFLKIVDVFLEKDKGGIK